MAAFADANVHYVNEEYEEALERYTAAISQEDAVAYRCARAACYLKLGRFKESLEDAEAALQREAKCAMALYWKGIAHFYMGDFLSSKASFEESKLLRPSENCSIWVRKCDAELSNSSLPLIGVTAEVSHVAKQSTQAAAPAVAAPAPAAPAPERTEVVDRPNPVSISGRKPVKREWYQNSNEVIITLFAKGVEKESCKSEFKEKEISVSFPLPGASDEEYQLNLDLAFEVVPSSCRLEVSKVKVEVILQKKEPGCKWQNLERSEEPVLAARQEPPELPVYPTSNKQKRNWNQIDREIEEELKNEKPDGDQALNKLFQQIYERADEDTRRAMNKSFQTSGGTVLSTNWGEVASNDYEGKDRPTPPDGQEWRDWRKK